MAFGLRHNIHKGQGFIVFINLVTGNFTVKHFGENIALIISFSALGHHVLLVLLSIG